MIAKILSPETSKLIRVCMLKSSRTEISDLTKDQTPNSIREHGGDDFAKFPLDAYPMKDFGRLGSP